MPPHLLLFTRCHDLPVSFQTIFRFCYQSVISRDNKNHNKKQAFRRKPAIISNSEYETISEIKYLFWGTPHYSRRGTFHHPVASLRTSRKRVHDMNQNPVPSACFGKLSKRNLCDNNEASKSSEFAVFTRLPVISHQYIAA